VDKVPSEKQESLASYWQAGSEIAFDSAAEILEKTSQCAMVLFQLHLSVEKALKSKIVQRTGEYAPYSHNLVFLFSKLSVASNAEQFEALSRFSQYNMTTRYPDDKKALFDLSSRSLAEAEVISAKELLKWISTL
jgi:HEPN domain-containing protein